MNLREYKKYFTGPNLYYDKTNLAIIDDEILNGQAKKDIQEALSRLRNNEDFYQLIKEYNGSLTKQNFQRGELPKDIEDQLFSMSEGEFTDVLALAGSYQIIKLEKKDLDRGVLTLSFIIVETVNLDDLLKEQRDKAEIEIYIY